MILVLIPLALEQGYSIWQKTLVILSTLFRSSIETIGWESLLQRIYSVHFLHIGPLAHLAKLI